MDTAYTLVATALAAALVSHLATWGAAWLARKTGALDRPGGYKTHALPTPLLGGLAVALGTLAGVSWSAQRSAGESPALVALAAGSLVILIAGLVDDLRGLSPRHKLAWQVAAAAAAGLCLAFLGVRLHLFLPWPAPLLAGVTLLWVVGVTNAFNFADNMNGLCAGLGALAAAGLALANLRSGELAVAFASAALAGACIGFLPRNWPRARIFLGDTGSMFIGFNVAALAVMGVYTPGAAVPGLAILVPPLLLAVPLLDLLVVVLLRLVEGQPFWRGDRRHLSHRLVKRGMAPAAAVATLWAAAAACGLVALALPLLEMRHALILLAALLAALTALLLAAGRQGLP